MNNQNYFGYVQSDGKARIEIPASLAVNTYTAKITYGGETNILGKTIKINVVVNRATLKLTAANKKFKLKDKTKKYAVALKTDKNKVYKYKKISLKVNGKVYHANTNKKGIATFKLSKLIKKGTFKAKIKFAGDSNYKAISKTVKITVK